MRAAVTASEPGFPQRLRERELSMGLLVKMPAPALVEMAGFAGFDFVVIDTEHGADDHTQLEHHLRAADAVGIASIVRVGSPDSALIGRVLDSGAAGVIIPHVTSADGARRAVDAAHYPPFGKRGLATSTRAGRHTMVSTLEHLNEAASRTVVIAQIEDAEAIPLAQEIAATPRLDCVWIGPNDLAMSLGKPRSHADVDSAEAQIIEGVLASRSAVLAVLADGHEDATRWIERGASVIVFSAPSLIAATFTTLVAQVKLIDDTRTTMAL